MDYCSTCRRHLNGALMCPGCGAYAPDIAPLADGTPAPAAATAAAARQVPSAQWGDTDSGAAEYSHTPQEQPYDGPDAPSPAATGRAARRLQRERWKKTQRRALVATAVALVGGGLTVSSLNRQTPDRTQATSAPDREVMGMAEEQATEPTPVASTPPDTRRAKHASPGTRSATTNTPHEQSAAAPQSTPVSPGNQQYSVTVPQTKATPPAPAQAPAQAVSTVPDATDTATETKATPAPAPPATDSTGTGTGTGTSGTDTSGSDTSGSDTSSATPPASESSSPPASPELCVLGLVCIS